MDMREILRQVSVACRHLLSQQNRDPYAAAYGCFDRRYWGWKLVDCPEVTFQRNVYPLAWWLGRVGEEEPIKKRVLVEAVEAGLSFAVQFQHRDGSFDQAFPNEHSFGATAFLLSPLLAAYLSVQEQAPLSDEDAVRDMLYRAARFLCEHDETHGHIANHLAGAVLALLRSAQYFDEPRFSQRASELLDRVLVHQSSEGWFLEYEGADPGYQTLCLYYLAQVYSLDPDFPGLREALAKAIHFIAWFVHPDGTFAGEYGSRRTAVFYPGGLALLSRHFPMALRITRFMLDSIAQRRTVTLEDVDMGNLAPLLSSYLLVLDASLPDETQEPLPLPWEQGEVDGDFTEAGLFVRGRQRYYAIFGAGNGGVLKVFDRSKRTLLWNDGGYAGQTDQGRYMTSQMTGNSEVEVSSEEVTLQTSFYTMLRSTPTPLQFILLRLANLTVMQNLFVGNLVKDTLVRLLIRGKHRLPVDLTRCVHFAPGAVRVRDILRLRGRTKVRWLACGRPFVAIHMASARYFDGFPGLRSSARQVDVDSLNEAGHLVIEVAI